MRYLRLWVSSDGIFLLLSLLLSPSSFRAVNIELKILDLNPSPAILSTGDCGKVCKLFIIKWT